MEDTGASSGHHQAAGVASSTGLAEIEKLCETWVRGEGKGGLGRGGGGETRGGGGGRHSRRYTEQRGFTLCHIRTAGSMWKAARQLSVLHSKSCSDERPEAL